MDKYLNFDLPSPSENIAVLKSKDPRPTDDLETIIRNSLENPVGSDKLSRIVHSGTKVAVLFDDWTRTTPISEIAPIVLDELKTGGVKDDDITFVCGNGMHAPDYMTNEKLIHKLGEDIFSKYKVISHDAYDYDGLNFIGVTDRLGTPLVINKYVAEADVKVALGRIVPHCDVGYSGGAKMIMPGVADIWGIIHNHSGSYPHIGTLANPLREDIDECGQMAGLDFIVNVVPNSKDEVIRAFAGNPLKAQRKGVEFGDKEVWGAKFSKKADIVITSPGLNNDGYFMSSTQCLELASRCLKKDGTIILVASCNQGWARDDYLESGWRVKKNLLSYSYPELLRLVVSRAWHGPYQQFQALVYFAQHVSKICYEKNVILVGSTELHKEETQKLGISFEQSLDRAVKKAVEEHSEEVGVIVIPNTFTLPLENYHKAK